MEYGKIVKQITKETGLPVTRVRRLIVGHGELEPDHGTRCFLCLREFNHAGQHVLQLLTEYGPKICSKFLCADRVECRARVKQNEKAVESSFVT